MNTPDAADRTAAREALVRQLLARAGANAGIDEAAPRPTQPGELQLIAIWEEVLERTAIGADDDYFALGGDSISAVAVVSRAQAAGIALTTQDLFELRTVGAITAALADLSPVAPPGASRSGAKSRPDRIRLTPLQDGMLYQSLADPSGTTQLVQVGAQLTGDIDVDQFSAACQTVARRYGALRASVRWDATGSWMVAADDVVLPVQVVDLRDVPVMAQPAAVQREIDRDLARGMDLRSPPLVRITLLRLADDVLRFLLTHHHLVLDGWSQQIVLRDMLDLYDGVDPAALPAPHDGTADHRTWLSGLDAGGGTSRWRELMAGFRPAPLAPRPSDAVSGPRAVTVPGPIPDLSAAARRWEVTPATLVYAAWSVLIAEITRSDDVAIGVTLSGRPALLPRAGSAVGMFIATLPLRVRPDPGEMLASWLHRVQRGRVELEGLQHCALTDIARATSTVPAAGHERLFDTIVVVENFPEWVVEGTHSRRLAVSSVTGSVWEGYPLVLETRIGPQGSILLRADASVLPEARVRTLSSTVHALLEAMGTADSVADLRSIARRHLESAGDPGRAPREARRQVVAGPSADEAGSA
ncbi:hypothetical protein GB931_02990 [Modestobacter sp. I12A-02628]|uniref:Carrier domain-containing protein n=1 Tax=Goekera deserti TaxID=2497753 RepID=A0A7K3WD03_9ACTN|nr:condensation domain-containing protein [Goekera deserti]MPQ96904.1 hypothetical protein [Goekera deserti]NDI46783.1 hypothetical protein [Goekera deserti]NEL54352.1 hypothetical protein [Goekera deserti]